jgi:DNA-binding MarR family transcriptional regulator
MKNKPEGNITRDGNLWFMLANTCFMISRLLELELAPHSITVEQSMLLKTLRDSTVPLSARDLEQITLRRQHSISIIINRMAKQGLISRTRKGNDKKSTILVTEKGEQVLEILTFKSLDSTFKSLTGKEKQSLFNCLQILDATAKNLLVVNDQPLFLRILASKNKDVQKRPSTSRTKSITNQQLWSLLNSVVFAITRLRELELEPLGLSMMQSLVLKILQDNGGAMTPGYLQDITMRQHHSISTLLTRMVKLGMIKRVKGTRGKRGSISFTSRGKDLHNRMTQYGLEMTVSTLDDDHKKLLAQYLQVLRNQAKDLLLLEQKSR